MTKEEYDKVGGYAFPVSLHGWGDNGVAGMTLRDYFAAQIAPSLTQYLREECANALPDGMPKVLEDIAVISYGIADAMIKHRKGE